MKKIVFGVIGAIFLSIVLVVLIPAKYQIQYVTTAEIERAFNKEQTFVLVLGYSWCSLCQEYKEKTLDDYEGSTKILYLEMDNFFDDNDERNAFFKPFGIEPLYTPTTYYINKGKEVSKKYGSMNEEELLTFIEDNQNK